MEVVKFLNMRNWILHRIQHHLEDHQICNDLILAEQLLQLLLQKNVLTIQLLVQFVLTLHQIRKCSLMRNMVCKTGRKPNTHPVEVHNFELQEQEVLHHNFLRSVNTAIQVLFESIVQCIWFVKEYYLKKYSEYALWIGLLHEEQKS